MIHSTRRRALGLIGLLLGLLGIGWLPGRSAAAREIQGGGHREGRLRANPPLHSVKRHGR